MVGRLRLWSGYVLLFYVTTHLLNHALGLISLRIVEAGRVWFVFLWQGLPGQIALYGALLVHLVLAMWALLRRRTLHLSPWEWTQFTLGWSIIPLGALHVVGTRVGHDYFGVHSGYPWVLGSLVAGGWFGIVRQFALPFVVWIHACIGIHFAWRLRPWYRDWLPVLYAVALLVPEELKATMLLASMTVPLFTAMPPPLFCAELPVIVLFTMTAPVELPT